LGLAAPLPLEGKKILQELCRGKTDWDDPVPENIRIMWEKWRKELHVLEELSVPKCYKPANFGHTISAELHHFSDASTRGYGQCSYLRLKKDQGQVHCSFVIGKARVTPLKPITVPRLELTAAVVSVKTSEQLQRELEYEEVRDVFWTDSKVVLGYIANETRFHIFVANWLQQIQDRTSPNQWHYVDTKLNPADHASRGLSAQGLLKSNWIIGPTFLLKEESQWHTPCRARNKKCCSCHTMTLKLRRASAWLPMLKNPLQICSVGWITSQIFTGKESHRPLLQLRAEAQGTNIPQDSVKHSKDFKFYHSRSHGAS